MRTPCTLPLDPSLHPIGREEEVTDYKLDYAPGRFSGGNNAEASDTVTDCLLLKCFLTEI